MDDMVKLNGHRVRLGEIEQKILSSGLVDSAAVKVINRNGGVWVCAYVVTDQENCSDALLETFRRDLPEFMIPKQVMQIPQIPLNKNGKVDRARLPDPPVQIKDVNRHNDREQFKQLMNVAQDLFLHQDINSSTNFFSIGGDSIKAIQLSSHLSEKGYNLSVKDIMLHPIFEDMSTYMCTIGTEHKSEPVRGTVDKLPNVCWLVNQEDEIAQCYRQSIVIKLSKDEPMQKIYQAFAVLVQHHDALRINYDTKTECLFYNDNHFAKVPQIEIIHTEKAWMEYQNEMIRTVHTKFDLANDLLFRVYAIYARDGVYLFMIFHHLISDGVSLRILLDDLSNLLSQANLEVTHNYSGKTVSYQQYAKAFLEWSRSMKIDVQHWGAYMIESGDTNRWLSLVRDSCEFQINKEISEHILGGANTAYHTKGEELLLIAWKLTLQQFLGFSCLVIEAESHGRDAFENMDTSRTVGWFSMAYPVSIEVKQGATRDIIISYKEQIRSAFQRRYEYGTCKWIKEYQVPMVHMARFNYLGNCDLPKGTPFKLVSVFPDNALTAPDTNIYPVELDIALIHGTLHCRIICKEYQASWLADVFKEHLTEIVKHCLAQDNYTYTPSDFSEADLTQQELDMILDTL